MAFQSIFSLFGKNPCTCVREKHHYPNYKLYSHDNNMNLGILPPELPGLSQVEELLISQQAQSKII